MLTCLERLQLVLTIGSLTPMFKSFFTDMTNVMH